MKFVVYQNDRECIVCTKKNEKEFLREWFEDTGRYVDDFDREVIQSSGVSFSSIINFK